VRRPCRTIRATTSISTPDQAAEIERLIGLGAKRVDDWDGYRDDSDFIVLEDTEGNRFCVIDTGGR
jgi:hypothetical protein